jgi:hypothetical protein
MVQEHRYAGLVTLHRAHRPLPTVGLETQRDTRRHRAVLKEPHRLITRFSYRLLENAVRAHSGSRARLAIRSRDHVK